MLVDVEVVAEEPVDAAVGTAPAAAPILSLPMLLVMLAADTAEAAVDVRDTPDAVVVVVASLSEGARERGMLDEEDGAVVAAGPVEERMGM